MSLTHLFYRILDGMLEILLLNVQFVKHQAAQEALPTVSVETTAPSAASHEEYDLLSQCA